jgi:prolyl 4-hydroxylase
MASSNNNGFRLGLEYLIPLAFLLLIAGGPIQQFLFGDRTTSLLSTHEIPVLDAEKLVVPDANLACPPHSYETHILSTEPLVVYISGFLSDAEADHLVEIR